MFPPLLSLLSVFRFILEPSFRQQRNFALLVFATLAPETLQLVALSFDLRLIPANFVVLTVVLLFLPLDLVADERAGAKAQTAADGCAGGRMAHGTADKSAHGRAAKGAYSGALFSGR